MEYYSISYGTPLHRELSDIRRLINSENAILFWSRTITTHYLLPIISALSYFTGTNVLFKNYKLNRNDSAYYLFEAVERNISERYFTNITPQMYDDNTPYTNLVINTVSIPYQITTTFETTIPEYVRNNGYTELNAYSLVFKQSPRHRIRVYSKTITPNNVPINVVTIFTASNPADYDLQLYRKIAATIPLLVNQQIQQDEEHPLSDVLQTRIPIFRMLENTEDAEVFLTAVKEYLKTLPAYTQVEMLETISTLQNLNIFHKRNVERNLTNINADITNAEANLTQLLTQQRALQYEYAGMSDTSLTSDDLKMLINKNVISNPKLYDDRLTYVCKAPCLSFDKQAAIAYYKRLNSDDNNTFKHLFKLAFIDEKIILQFDDVITINFKDITCTGRTVPNNYVYSNKTMRNPHHNHFDCWGNYSNVIKKLIKEYDFIQLFLQIKAAVGSINLVDYTVLSYFKNDIRTHLSGEYNYPREYGPFIIWKDEGDMSKLHTIKDTLDKYIIGADNNETD